jgi:muconolactone D-isomerase
MLFQVEMNVWLPHDLPGREGRKRARATRRRLAPSVASGPLRQRQIADAQEQNGILSSLPLFPFMDMRITPLCRQPPSVHDD